MRRLAAVAGAIAFAGLGTGSAGASSAASGGETHLVTSNHWTATTFVTGLESCDLLGGFVFHNVDLTDQINVTYSTPNPLFLLNGVASFHGVINTPSGQYHVDGSSTARNVVTSILPPFIGTDGHATISGPTGIVTGRATFQDLLWFPPAEFDILFRSITNCKLK